MNASTLIAARAAGLTTLVQAAALAVVCEAPAPLNCTEVARALGISSAAVLLVADRLDALKLTVSLPRPGDRRMRLLAATAKGRRLLGQDEHSRP